MRVINFVDDRQTLHRWQRWDVDIITIIPGSCSVMFCPTASVLMFGDLGWYLDRVSLAFYVLDDLTHAEYKKNHSFR